MSSKVLITIFLLSSALSAIEYPSFNFKNAPGKLVTYSIYRINADGSEGKEVVKGISLKKKIFSNSYKVEFDFSSGNYRIKFNYKNKNNTKYHTAIDLDKRWFIKPFSDKKRQVNSKNKFKTGITMEERTYPYSFTVELTKKNPILRGYVFTRDDENYEVPVADAIIRLNNTTKIKSSYKNAFINSSSDGSFNWDVAFDSEISEGSSPGIIVTKKGYHIEEAFYTTDEINDARITGERQVYLKRRISPKNNLDNFQTCEYPLVYDNNCDECVCNDTNLTWYPRQGVCAIDERSCNEGEMVTFINESNTDSLVYGKMIAKCFNYVGESEQLVTKEYVDNVFISLRVMLDGFPIEGASIKYKKYTDKQGSMKVLGVTNKSGNMFVNSSKLNLKYEYISNRDTLNILESIDDLNLTSINSDNYFYLNKKYIKKNRPHKFIISYEGRDFTISLKNKINDISFRDISCGNVSINIDTDGDSPKFDFSLSEVKQEVDDNQINIERGEYKQHNDQNSEYCAAIYSKIDDLVSKCKWDDQNEVAGETSNLRDEVDEAIEYCVIDNSTETLQKIILSFYHRILDFDDTKFLDELAISSETEEILTFSKLDALYERYDQVKGAVESNLSNYEIAFHYYRKFMFYFLYAEYLAINQVEIETDLMQPTVWIYDYDSCQECFESNFRDLPDIDVYRHISSRANEALKQFYIVKNRAKGEKLPDFYELELMEDRLDIILKEWRHI